MSSINCSIASNRSCASLASIPLSTISSANPSGTSKPKVAKADSTPAISELLFAIYAIDALKAESCNPLGALVLTRNINLSPEIDPKLNELVLTLWSSSPLT